VLSVTDAHVKKATEIADRIQAGNVRVGIDDRGETVGKKVREAKQDWVSFVIVVGDKELSSDRLSVYDRSQNKNLEMGADQLIERIQKETAGKPFHRLYMPREMSKQVNFG
jgi:threonyl-tRNA synthetase